MMLLMVICIVSRYLLDKLIEKRSFQVTNNNRKQQTEQFILTYTLKMVIYMG